MVSQIYQIYAKFHMKMKFCVKMEFDLTPQPPLNRPLQIMGSQEIYVSCVILRYATTRGDTEYEIRQQ